jgi:phosphoserine phosphatase RsbU/P
MAKEDDITPQQMRLVLDVARMLAMTTDLDALLQRIAEATTAILKCERASIFLHDAQRQQLWTKVALRSGEIRVPQTAGIVGAAFMSNQLIDVADPYSDPRFNPENDRRTGFVTRNILASPMNDIDGKPLGVIQAINRHKGSFTPGHGILIQLLAGQAGVALQRYRLQVAAMDVVAMKREMDLARKVQDAMLPKSPPSLPGLQAAGFTKPASTTGGDVFDLWLTPNGRLGIFLGDASGHGLAPTLVVSQVRTLVRTLSEMDHDPLSIMGRINSRMACDLEAGRFVTAFLGFMDSNGLLEYSSAGHGPIVVADSGSQAFRLVDPALPPLGVLDDMPTDRSEPIQFAEGGLLAVLSDGLFEARNAEGELFGIERVCENLEKWRGQPPAKVIEQLYEVVRAWQRTDDPADDQTFVLARPEK